MVLALWVTCIVVLPILTLVLYVVHTFYVVRTTRTGRFRFRVKLFKVLDIEVDAQNGPDELPGNQSGQT